MQAAQEAAKNWRGFGNARTAARATGCGPSWKMRGCPRRRSALEFDFGCPHPMCKQRRLGSASLCRLIAALVAFRLHVHRQSWLLVGGEMPSVCAGADGHLSGAAMIRAAWAAIAALWRGYSASA